MPGEIGDQAIKVSWRTSEVTLKALLGLCQELLANRDKTQHGEQSLKKLNLQGRQLESVELAGEDMKAFRRELQKYSVDYSIRKEPETGHYQVFFKAQDVDRVYTGLEKCVANYAKKSDKKPIKEVMQEAEQKAAARQAERQSAPDKSKSADRGHDDR